LPFVDLSQPKSSGIYRVSATSFAVVGSTTSSPKELAHVSIVDPGVPVVKTLKSSMGLSIPKEMFSIATYIAVPRTAGSDKSGVVHLLYFPPHNPKFIGEPDTLPPLLVLLHGGPNGVVAPALDMTIQFWTSRGYALCAVNYAGSSGFGRDYRERLSGWWGILDTADTASAVNYLVKENMVDGSRVGVYGGSAGGYATLQSLHMYPDLWAAGVSLYGISDIEALAADSYKFESHDVDRILLSLTAPEDKKSVMRERSARYHVEKITAPLLLLQGSIDVAVPPAQTWGMARVMQSGGKVARVVEFEGEGHGWIKRDSIKRSFQEQEKWWEKYLVRPGPLTS
jgi:dipeptidyl aminopeptidase/acylaminoacyl peptidase